MPCSCSHSLIVAGWWAPSTRMVSSQSSSSWKPARSWKLLGEMPASWTHDPSLCRHQNLQVWWSRKASNAGQQCTHHIKA